MLIGNQYSDNKIYRGIQHYDSLPLTSGDIHEYADTSYMKNAYIMNNIIGYGVLNSPEVSISTQGIKLSEPSVVIIDGDISLIQTDTNVNLATTSEISSKGYGNGVVCVVGWYQKLTSTSTLRSYGGVSNSILTNDIASNSLNIQVSTRYQFRWTTCIVSKSALNSASISITIPNRDDTGAVTTGNTTITSREKVGNVYVANKPSSMTYALSDIYIVPIVEYTYANSSITAAYAVLPTKTKGSSDFIVQESQPTGTYLEGTTWYKPSTRKFYIYIKDTGFVNTSPAMAMLQYQSTYIIPSTITTSQNVEVPINISQLEEGDMVIVDYEGLVLSVGDHYTINYADKKITLLGFTTVANEKVHFTVIKYFESTDTINLASEFTEHKTQVNSILSSGVGSFNSNYVNKDITDDLRSHIADYRERISTQTFKDMYCGMYWTYNGRRYRFIEANTKLNQGDVRCTTPHIAIVPDQSLGNMSMNNTNTTVGGYHSSSGKITLDYTSISEIEAACNYVGFSILQYRELISTGVDTSKKTPAGLDGASNSWDWKDLKAALLTEIQVCGNSLLSSSYMDAGTDLHQLASFRMNPALISVGNYNYWLRNVASSTAFCVMDKRGVVVNEQAATTQASRPIFYVY